MNKPEVYSAERQEISAVRGRKHLTTEVDAAMAESTVSFNLQEGGAALKGLGCGWLGDPHCETGNHRVIESFRLEKTLKIIESNRKPNTAKFTT